MIPRLSAAAKKIWNQTVPILMQTPGLLTVLDGSVLGSFCEVSAARDNVLSAISAGEKRALAAWRESERKKEMTAVEVKAAVFHKYKDEYKELEHRLNVLRREIGLSASARSSIRIAGGPDGAVKPKIDPLDQSFSARPKLVKMD